MMSEFHVKSCCVITAISLLSNLEKTTTACQPVTGDDDVHPPAF